jgi:hypothetical protein
VTSTDIQLNNEPDDPIENNQNGEDVVMTVYDHYEQSDHQYDDEIDDGDVVINSEDEFEQGI